MIFKFQQGGVTPPFVAYQPVIVSDKRTTSTSEMAEKVATDSEKGKLSDKDLYTMLKEKLKGLPSDVEEAMTKIQQVENIAKMDFDGMKTWTRGCSPSNHSLFYNAIHEDELQEFWGLQNVIKKEYDLTDIRQDNYKDIIFGTIEELKVQS